MSKIWNTALENNPNQLMQLEFLSQHPLNDPYDLLLNLLSTYYWLTCGRCKKSPTTNKETLLNGNKFYMTAFNTRFECPKVALECHYLAFCTVGFQSWLNWKMKCRMQCKAIENCSNFSSSCSYRNRWLIDQGSYFKYSVTAVIKKLFQSKHFAVKIFEMIWVAPHYSFQLICYAMQCIIKSSRCCWPSFNWEYVS